jgi:predicted  nucleic acid-binding Zn-ribbon protein
MATTLETIVELHRVLHGLEQARQRLLALPEPMQELHQEHQKHQQEIERLEGEIREGETLRRAAEGKAQEAQSKIAHFQEQIGRVTTQREYGALLSEIDTAKAQQRQCEDEALAALERVEAATAQRTALGAEFQDLDRRYREGLLLWEAEKPDIQAQIGRLEGTSQTLRERLPKSALTIFERLYERHGGEPLARIVRLERSGGPTLYRCSVCNYQVRPQAVVEIRGSAELRICDCGQQRIFYLDE